MHDPALVAHLVAWYARNARDLPWRRNPTPYRVLLSELMCQQTRVETALPYFHRFLERWPDLDALAAAREEEVLQEWAGLGYYSRARNLLRCAREAVARGGLPRSARALRALPGIGPYTAGAIASIAFGERTAVVDGNVERVVSRLDARTEDPRSTAGRKALWARVEALHEVHTGHPGALNQALMELGATVCSPRRPACPSCPVAEWCGGRAQGIAETLPRKAPRTKPVPVRGATGVLEWGRAVVLGRRHPRGLLGGLWEPPRADVAGEGSSRDAVAQVYRDGVGLEVEVGAVLGTVTHVFSHRRLTLEVFAVHAPPARLSPGGDYATATASDDPVSLGLSTLARKVLALRAQPSLPLAADSGPE